MASLTVKTIDGTIALVPDMEACALLNVNEGDFLKLDVDQNGRTTVSRLDETERQIVIGEDIMRRYRKTFKDLAK